MERQSDQNDQTGTHTPGVDEQEPDPASDLALMSNQSTTEGERRKTTRLNAGKPPDRLGDIIEFSSKPRPKKITPEPSRSEEEQLNEVNSNKDNQSNKSNSSTCSTLKKAQIEDKKIRRVAALEKEHRDKQKALCHMERDLLNMEKQIAIKTKQVQEGDPQTDANTVAEMQQQYDYLLEDIERAKIDLRFEAEDVKSQREQILQQAEVEKQKVDANSSSIIDQLSEVDKNKSVEEWANSAHLGDKDEDEQKSEGSDKAESIHVGRSKDKKTTHSRTRSKRRKSQGQPEEPMSNTFEEFAKCMVAAMSNAAPNSQPSTSDRLLARQVQGKELPFFSGRPEEWPAFQTAFDNSTTNCGFSNADNLPRLQKCLKGDALRTVQCMLINPDSVPKAMDKLKKRFGKPEVIIKSLISKVRECPPVKADRIESVVEFGLAVEDLTSTIVALKCTEHLANPMLLDDLIKKLPVAHQFEWLRFVQVHNSKPKNLELFSEWLGGVTEAAYELCPPKPPDVKHDRRNPRQSERVHVAKEETEGKKNPKNRTCPCCSKPGHKIHDCPSFAAKPVKERVDIVKQKRLCFGCLNGGHSFKECRTKKPCGISNCKKLHPKLLHFEGRADTQTDSITEERVEAESPESVRMTRNSTAINHMVIPVYLKGPSGIEKSYVVLDNYSTVTTIVEKMANSIGADGEEKPLTVTGFNSTATHPSKSVEVTIQDSYGNFECKLKNVRTVQRLDLARQSLRKEDIRKWKHLKKLKLETYQDVQPTMIIGMDNHHLFIQEDCRVGKGEAPAAVKTPLGWVVIGRLDAHKKQDFSFHIREEVDDDLHQLVKSFFTTESFGVRPTDNKPRSREDKRAQQILDTTLRRVDQGWETGLLWKDDDVQLPESKHLAMSRLSTMERKMDRDPQFAQQYQQRIQEYEKKGFATKLHPAEASLEGPKTFYIPHFMAYNPKKPDKYRFVFDAAAKTHGRSLNSFLLQGPDKLSPLPGVLMKFRQCPIAITADIKDMFHKVKLRKEDSMAHRFLFRGMSRDREPDIYQMNVLIFGAACSPVCAQEVKNRNALEFKKEFPKASEAVVNRHYVDDYLDSCPSLEEAIQRYKEVFEIQKRGDFHLYNWLSNSVQFMEQIPEDMRSKSAKNMAMGEMETERVLGLFWKPDQDNFTFSLTYLKAKKDLLQGVRAPTKRELLSLVMSLYDPLGFLATLTVKAKMMIQSAWRTGVNWEDQIPIDVHDDWKSWLHELKRIPEFRLSRCYSDNFHHAEEIELHIFGDASQEAFGAVAYFVVKKDGQVDTSLVMAKSKVAPIKILTIPRLELQAAVMGSRLAHFILEQIEMKISRIVLWTDSTTVLSWIRNETRRFQQFVSNRVGEIQELTNVAQWRWLPTEENVADELTRKSKPCDWSPSSRWIHGPEWLKGPEEDWPVERKSDKEDLTEEIVMKINEAVPVIDLSRFSSWQKLIRTTAYVLRFINIKTRKQNSPAAITVHELANAETTWLKQVQQQVFGEELQALSIGESKVSKSSRLRNLNLFIDEKKIIRVCSRLQNASILTRDVKSPVVLDARHPYCRLLIQYYHQTCGHHGHERICNEIRQKYWILGLRSAVRRAKINCQQCKNSQAKSTNPIMGQLPQFRVQANVHPFQNTGLDYFGPIEVVVKRSHAKRYVALFTCLSTRAIHLELANFLTTDSCILAIRRFISRRGCPVRIQSDNGTNFHGAANEMREALQELNQQQLETECSSRGIQWRFNPPAAPHMGGSWERMVRSVKVALGAVIKMKSLTDEVLGTLLAEAEHTVNSHPLTHVADDPDDPEALTPNHFLIGRSSNLQQAGDFKKDDLVGRKHWRMVQHMADCFWRRWVREYLPTLTRREKWCQPTKPIQIGDVVIEANETLERNSWPRGIVIATYPGKDDIIRVVDVRRSNGHIHKRPVSRLCVLDVQPCKKESSESVNSSQK